MRTLMNMSDNSPSKQHGAVIIVILILLLFISMGGLSLISGIKIDTKMNDNFEQKSLSFQAAEEALSRIEKTLISDKDFKEANFLSTCVGDGCFTNNCVGGLCRTVDYTIAGVGNCALSEDEPPWRNSTTRAAAPSVEVKLDRSQFDQGKIIKLNVKYLVEFRCYVPKTENPSSDLDWSPYFRVTAWLENDATNVLQAPTMLQSTYIKG